MHKMLKLVACSVVLASVGCGGGGGGGSDCGGTAGNACPEGSYCKVELGLCGGEGKCTEIPASCDPNLPPSVCSCEGISFFNECFAAQAGQGVQSIGDCANQ